MTELLQQISTVLPPYAWERLHDVLPLVDEWLLGVQMLAAASGAIAVYLRARLLIATCIGCGAAVIWMMATGVEPESLMPALRIGLAALFAVGLVEALIILIGGREAVPYFWATFLAGLLLAILILPLRAVAKGLGLLSGGWGTRR